MAIRPAKIGFEGIRLSVYPVELALSIEEYSLQNTLARMILVALLFAACQRTRSHNLTELLFMRNLNLHTCPSRTELQYLFDEICRPADSVHPADGSLQVLSGIPVLRLSKNERYGFAEPGRSEPMP